MIVRAGLESLTEKHVARGLLIDTNVLLLFLVGLYDEAYIQVFKRTQQYTVEDFHLVRDFAAPFHRLITTPHILSELSNLSLALKGERVQGYFAYLVEVLRKAKEIHIGKDELLANKSLPRFGFTDLSITEAAKRYDYLVFTDDFGMAGLLHAGKCDVINLNHLRQMYWSQ